MGDAAGELLLEKKIPPFGYILLWIVTILLALTILWSIQTPKIYTVPAEGSVTGMSNLMTYVEPSDIARIHEGDSVRIAIDGLPASSYGTIQGSVSRIHYNVTSIDSAAGSRAVFEVEITPEVSYLVGKNGEQLNLIPGMTAQVHIQYAKTSYFQYIIDKFVSGTTGM